MCLGKASVCGVWVLSIAREGVGCLVTRLSTLKLEGWLLIAIGWRTSGQYHAAS